MLSVVKKRTYPCSLKEHLLCLWKVPGSVLGIFRWGTGSFLSETELWLSWTASPASPGSSSREKEVDEIEVLSCSELSAAPGGCDAECLATLQNLACDPQFGNHWYKLFWYWKGQIQYDDMARKPKDGRLESELGNTWAYIKIAAGTKEGMF